MAEIFPVAFEECDTLEPSLHMDFVTADNNEMGAAASLLRNGKLDFEALSPKNESDTGPDVLSQSGYPTSPDARFLWQKMADMESRMATLEHETFTLRQCLSAMQKNGPSSSRDCITQNMFNDMVDEAVRAGTRSNLGCSKIFLRQFLKSEKKMVDGTYLRRRLNALLKKRVQEGVYFFENDLYSFVH